MLTCSSSFDCLVYEKCRTGIIVLKSEKLTVYQADRGARQFFKRSFPRMKFRFLFFSMLILLTQISFRVPPSELKNRFVASIFCLFTSFVQFHFFKGKIKVFYHFFMRRYSIVIFYGIILQIIIFWDNSCRCLCCIASCDCFLCEMFLRQCWSPSRWASLSFNSSRNSTTAAHLAFFKLISVKPRLKFWLNDLLCVFPKSLMQWLS